MVNLWARIPGARPDRIVLAGHYDTKRVREFRFVGANDGGSSTAFLLEMARVLKSRTNALTIDILFLDGEEAVIEWGGTDRVYGSRHYVETAIRDGSLASLRALILVDITPGSPADRAGLLPGDIILAIDGHAIEEPGDLAWGLTEAADGAAVRLDLVRGGVLREIAVLPEAPAPAP